MLWIIDDRLFNNRILMLCGSVVRVRLFLEPQREVGDAD